MLSQKSKVGNVPVQDITLASLFEKARHENKFSEALIMATGERINLQTVWTKVDCYAKGLLGLGIKRGDTISTIACISSEALYLFAAAISIGVGYSHPYIYTPREQSLDALLSVARPRLLMVGEGMSGSTMDTLVDKMNSQPDRYPFIEHMFYDNSINNRSPDYSWIKSLEDLSKFGENISDEELISAKKEVQPTDPCMHLFSSGSTGTSKCIVHTQYSMANEAVCQCPTDLGNIIVTSNNVDELCGYAGLGLGLCGFASKVVVGLDLDEEDTFREKLSILADVINEESIEHVVMTSAYITGLAHLVKGGYTKFSTIRTAMLAGQIFSRTVREDIMKYLGAIPWTLYGASELVNMAVTSFDLSEEALEQRLEARMLPMCNTELKLVNDENEIVPVGATGHILCKKYSFLKEYKGLEPGKTEELFTKDGFYKTGDIGEMHPDGSIVIKGRHADAIRFKIFGEVVYPGPIEMAIAKMPAVRAVQVVSVSGNDVVGDEIIACLCLNEGFDKPTGEEICNLVNDELDEMKRPCRIAFFDEFPRTANSRKVSKNAIREKLVKWIEEDALFGITPWFKDFCELLQLKANIF